MPRLPKLPKLGVFRDRQPKPFRQSVTQTTGIERSFQRRGTIARRRGGGIQQQEAGNPLELRAAQDIPGTLAFRIVLLELRRRELSFEFTSAAVGAAASAAGWQCDFLIQPNIAIDIAPGDNTPFLEYPTRDEYKAASLTAQNYQYTVLWAKDVEESALRLEELLDDIIGQYVVPLQVAESTTTLPFQVFNPSDILNMDDILDMNDMLVT